MQLTDQAMLTVGEAAEQMGVSRYWIWKLIKQGRLQAERHGKVWLIHEDWLSVIEPRPMGRPRKER